jgi:peptidoglycan hydrolase CwlO-like protein
MMSMQTVGANLGQRESYRSPARVLVAWFRDSRNAWKEKFQERQAELKRLKVRVSDVVQSREHWKHQAQQRAQELAALQAEVEQLRQRVSPPHAAEIAPEKNGLADGERGVDPAAR